MGGEGEGEEGRERKEQRKEEGGERGRRGGGGEEERRKGRSEDRNKGNVLFHSQTRDCLGMGPTLKECTI